MQSPIIAIALNEYERARKDKEASALNGTQERHDQLLVDAPLILLILFGGPAVPVLLKLVLYLIQLHELVLQVFQSFHLVAHELAVAQWKHAEVDALEGVALSPLFADR